MVYYLGKFPGLCDSIGYSPLRSGELELDEINKVSIDTNDPHWRYLLFLTERAQLSFRKLSANYRGKDIIGYVTISVTWSGAPSTAKPYEIELSRGGNKKVRIEPRRPPIRFYRYLDDGTRLTAEIRMSLTDPESDSEEYITCFEFCLEQLVIRKAMYVLGTHSTGRESPYYQARVATAVNVILSYAASGGKLISDYFGYCEAYGFNHRMEDFLEAEELATKILKSQSTSNPA
ncbi:hypothetical protein IKX12_00440 [Candidatus Saccharibacteria bacterium]|nr:hypothetical protein [Candidatus Saccharibacteria bacterium]